MIVLNVLINGELAYNLALVRLYWAEGNLAKEDEVMDETCPKCRIDRLTC
jgi:hypothetical protein